MRSGRCMVLFAAALFIASAVMFTPLPTWAVTSVEGDDFSLDLGASIRTTLACYQYYDEPQLFGEGNEMDGLSQTVLRWTLDGDYRDSVSFEGHLVQDVTWTTALSGFSVLGAFGESGAQRYRVDDLSWDWVDGEDWDGRIYVDRMNVKFSLPYVDVTIGRQAINFSQAYFWNPLDIFMPFDPDAFDRDYKPGVDAIRVDIALGRYSSLTLAAAAGREIKVGIGLEGPNLVAEAFDDEPWYGSALVARARTTIDEWDLTLQGGKVYGGWEVGGGFSGDLWKMGVSGEATWFSPFGDGTLTLGEFWEAEVLTEHATAVIGFFRSFENSFYFNAEYLYNGAGGDVFNGLLRAAIGETMGISKHVAGAQISYEFHPLLTGSLACIHSFSDSSNLITPTFSYSVSDESDLVGGATIGLGSRPRTVDDTIEGFASLELQSEFGTYPNIFFLEFKYYF